MENRINDINALLEHLKGLEYLEGEGKDFWFSKQGDLVFNTMEDVRKVLSQGNKGL